MKHIHKNQNKYTILVFAILGMFFFLSLVAFWLFKQPISPVPLESIAKEILATCKGEKNANLCYDKEIPKRMDPPSNIQMQQIFHLTRIIQSQDTTYNFCHVLGHKISEKETKKDPSKWQEVVGKCPQGVCSNGCIHGAFQERFRAESLSEKQIEAHKKELIDACQISSLTSGLSRGSCIHALGHLFMYATNANIKKSVSLCADFSRHAALEGYQSVCYDGAFMQIFQPLETEDYALIRNIKVNKTNVLAFCNQFTGDAKLSCWRESWPLAYKQITTPKGFEAFCKNLDVSQQGPCFTSLFYIIPVQFHMNTEKISNFCKNLSENISGECFGIAAVRFIQNDYKNGAAAKKFCQNVSREDFKDTCFEILAQYASFTFPKDGKLLEIFCDTLPPTYQQTCKKQ